jgi:hypothetical protein
MTFYGFVPVLGSPSGATNTDGLMMSVASHCSVFAERIPPVVNRNVVFFIIYRPHKLFRSMLEKTEPAHLIMHHSPGAATVVFCNFEHRMRRLLIAAKNY